MFGKKDKYKRRGKNPLMGLFRLIVSLAIFAVLLGGAYSAYKQFSGLDPVKVSPKALISNFISPEKLMNLEIGVLSVGEKKPTKVSSSEPNAVVKGTSDVKTNPSPKPRVPKVVFKFALVADSHNDNDLLQKAFQQAKDIKFVIGLGDYTDVGTIDELQKAKNVFDQAGVRYFVIPGDHDLWDSRDKNHPPKTNFASIFGNSYQSFSYQNARFLLIDNSDNYDGLGQAQFGWLQQELDRIRLENPQLILAFVHEPLYHPSSTRFMGKVTLSLKDEAKRLTSMFKQAGVKEIFAGDIHFFSRYTDPDSGLAMTTVGAVTSQRNAQLPRFAVVTVYDDGTYDVEDVEIK